MIYERSSHARIKTAILLSPMALFSNGKKHWLTITYKNGAKRILATVETEMGQDVEWILEAVQRCRLETAC